MYRKQIWAHCKTTAQSSLETLCVLTSSLSINRSLNGCFFLPWVECTHPPTGLPLYNWHDIVIILILTGCQPFNLFTQNGIHINMCHVSMIRACYHIISTLFLDLFPSNIIDIDNFCGRHIEYSSLHHHLDTLATFSSLVRNQISIHDKIKFH